MIKLSIIVPVYNVERYIRKCLDSLVNQTYKNLEIILVDDGSTDLSGVICDEYAKKDHRIIVIHKENEGLVNARKKGILLATGEYTTYVDSDDWIDENAYEKLVKDLIVYNPDVLAFGFIKEYSNFSQMRQELLPEGYYEREIFLKEGSKYIKRNHFFCPLVHISVWTKLFKTELIRKYQLKVNEKIRMGEDMAVVFPCILEAKSIVIKKECYYHYRVNKSSINWNKRNDMYDNCLELISCLKKSKDRFSDLGKGLDVYFLQIIYLYLILCSIEHCFQKDSRIVLFPKLNCNSNVIIYGKGVFASNLITVLKQKEYCNVVACIDRMDIERIKQISEKEYEFVIIAITQHTVIRTTLELLENQGIDKQKILFIQTENLTIENLPLEIQKIM